MPVYTIARQRPAGNSTSGTGAGLPRGKMEVQICPPDPFFPAKSTSAHSRSRELNGEGKTTDQSGRHKRTKSRQYKETSAVPWSSIRTLRGTSTATAPEECWVVHKW